MKDITEEYRNPILDENIDLAKAYELVTDKILAWDFSNEFPAWLQEAFVGVAAHSVSETIDAIEKLAIGNVLPKRYSEFVAAHSNNDRNIRILTELN